MNDRITINSYEEMKMNKHCLLSKILILCSVCFCIVACEIPVDEDGMFVTSKTTIDWDTYARQITSGATTDRDKVIKIYNYICENIAYDTDYKIYHADECWKAKKGVCNAYVEVFYYLLKAASIRSVKVSGYAHSGDTSSGLAAHAWNAVYYDGKWHLIDSCWGAGYVNDGVYGKRDDHSIWFEVDPYRMIFSHFPENREYAFIDVDVSEQVFKSFPSLPALFEIGKLNYNDMLKGFMDGSVTEFPEVHNYTIPKVCLVDVPFNRELKVGSTYKFRIIPDDISHWSLNTNNANYSEWVKESDGSFSLIYTPQQDDAILSLQGYYSGYMPMNVVVYTVIL